jgi:hypothetical protein
MSASRNEVVELYVFKKKEVAIVCPSCGLAKTVPVEPLRTKGHWEVKAKCTRCAHVFRINLNFRKYFRKTVTLQGQLLDAADATAPVARVLVRDISMEGAGLEVQETARSLSSGEILVLQFPTAEGGQLRKDVELKSVRGDRVGARFVDRRFDPAVFAWVSAK